MLELPQAIPGNQRILGQNILSWVTYRLMPGSTSPCTKAGGRGTLSKRGLTALRRGLPITARRTGRLHCRETHYYYIYPMRIFRVVGGSNTLPSDPLIAWNTSVMSMRVILPSSHFVFNGFLFSSPFSFVGGVSFHHSLPETLKL